MRFAVFFHVSMLSMKVNSIVILNFHWDLLYIVDMSECEKGSFWEVSVPKTSAAAIFSSDLYIFAKYAPVFSNSAFPTTFASHRHCHVRTYVQMRSFNFCSFSGQDVNWSGTLASTWTLLPHPTPPLRDVTHLQRSMTYVRNCAHVQVNVPWRNIMGVRKYVNVIIPHPTPPLRDVTHLQRSMTYVRNCAHVQVNVPWRNIMGVRKYVNIITPPHPKEHI